MININTDSLTGHNIVGAWHLFVLKLIVTREVWVWLWNHTLIVIYKSLASEHTLCNPPIWHLKWPKIWLEVILQIFMLPRCVWGKECKFLKLPLGLTCQIWKIQQSVYSFCGFLPSLYKMGVVHAVMVGGRLYKQSIFVTKCLCIFTKYLCKKVSLFFYKVSL